MEFFGIRFHKIPIFFSMSLLFELKAQSLRPSSSSGRECEDRAYREGICEFSIQRKKKRLLELTRVKAQGKGARNELVEKGFADSRYSAKRQRLLELTRVKAQSLQLRGTSVSRMVATPLFNKLTVKFKIVLIKNKINTKSYNCIYNI